MMDGFWWKKWAYFENTPRLMMANVSREIGKRLFMRDCESCGARRLKSSTPTMGRKMIRQRVRIITRSDISVVCPRRSLTIAGSVNGTMDEVTTTITSTRAVVPLTIFEMKGATTPVDMAEMSRAAVA